MILKGANYFQINWLVWASGSHQLICILYVLFFIFMNHFLFEVFIWHLVRSGSACVHSSPLSDFLNQEQEVIPVQRPTAVWLMLLLVFGSLVHPPDKVTAEKIQTSVSPQIWTIKGWSCAGFQLCSSTKPPWEPDGSLLFGEAPATSDMKNPTGPFSYWNVSFLMGPDLHYGCRSISAFMCILSVVHPWPASSLLSHFMLRLDYPPEAFAGLIGSVIEISATPLWRNPCLLSDISWRDFMKPNANFALEHSPQRLCLESSGRGAFTCCALIRSQS